MAKFDYPIDDNLIGRLKAEYRSEVPDKGNTWRTDCDTDYLMCKLKEEFYEVLSSFQRQFPNGHTQSELIDLLLVGAMLFQRLEKDG